MSLVKILDINVEFLKAAAKEDFIPGLDRDIEKKLDRLAESREFPCGRPDVTQLIRSIETAKYRFLQGQLTAQQLYREVTAQLARFKGTHHDFDHLNDPVLNAYFP
ncbi:MAG: hypothetical protein MUE76_06855 [Syntrophales bacterium]|nr:hypothetical protein [Syntrophales bacterium]